MLTHDEIDRAAEREFGLKTGLFPRVSLSRQTDKILDEFEKCYLEFQKASMNLLIYSPKKVSELIEDYRSLEGSSYSLIERLKESHKKTSHLSACIKRIDSLAHDLTWEYAIRYSNDSNKGNL